MVTQEVVCTSCSRDSFAVSSASSFPLILECPGSHNHINVRFLPFSTIKSFSSAALGFYLVTKFCCAIRLLRESVHIIFLTTLFQCFNLTASRIACSLAPLGVATSSVIMLTLSCLSRKGFQVFKAMLNSISIAEHA
jgi:hypothetical protein